MRQPRHTSHVSTIGHLLTGARDTIQAEPMIHCMGECRMWTRHVFHKKTRGLAVGMRIYFRCRACETVRQYGLEDAR